MIQTKNVEAEELMGMLRIGASDRRVLIEAAIRAHSQIVRAAVILSDTFDSTRLNELLDALHAQDYDRAVAIWPHVRQAIVAPRVG